ncbi:ROK family transcriptional regulator [Sinosporangium siamense]|uniref:Sugar kinase n=1 Tax=Sinosporangium siamense TaxID=1367973 RepID=A0A919RET9_9ACTN|nr:ROK family transcriptional regulator [Sinosporangium siamense]GII91109.1 sugar kinase [Sinosporangium siamense]
MAERAAPPGRDLSRTAILAALGQAGPLSRSELARRLDLSPATVTQVTRRLIAQGMVEELEHMPSRGGRPAQLLGLVGSAGRAVGVKIAADHAVAVDVRLDGELLDRRETELDASAPDCLERVATLVEPLIGRGARLLGVGVGVPGVVDSPDSGVVEAPTLGWSALAVGARLRARLDLPVLVDNDVNTIAIAERLYGRGRDHRDFLVVTIGRGIGLAIVVDGSLLRGASGSAGEFGHLPVATGPRCACGNVGCLEAVIGGPSLVERSLHASIAEMAADPTAATVFAEAGVVLGRAVAGLVNILDPAAILVLGEGTAQWHLWRPGFEEGFAAHLFRPHRRIPVEVDPWDDSRWAQGAAALVLGTPFDVATGTGTQGNLVLARLEGSTQ